MYLFPRLLEQSTTDGWLKTGDLFSHSSGGQKPKINVLQGYGPSNPSPEALPLPSAVSGRLQCVSAVGA